MSSGSIYIQKGEPIGSTGFSSPAVPRFGWRRLLGGLLLLVLGGIFTPVQAQYANGYSYRVEVDFVDAEVSGGPHTNFPVLISSTLLDLRTTGNGGKVEDANGYDIIFTSDLAGTTQLAHEIESYVSSTGEIVFWVRVESFVATTKIYMFYGNSGIATFQGDVTSNGVTGVWDNDYVGVWHLEEQGGGTHDDSTGVHDGTRVNNVYYAGEGRYAQTFDGAGDYVGVADHDDFTFANAGVDTAFSVSAWIQGETGEGAITSKYTDAGGGWEFYIDGGKLFAYTSEPDGNDWIGKGTSASVSGAWQHVTVTYDGSETNAGFKLYIDGVEQATSDYDGGSYGGMSNNTTDVTFGVEEGDNTYDLNGELDEVRISSEVRSANWIETGYNNQDSPSAFYLLGPKENNNTILLVVPNAASLGAQDAARKTLMESWGYTVALISANDTQANFDAAVATSDVAYVSEEISAADLNTKLTSATIGVVIEEGALLDEFGISTDVDYTDSAIDIIDNTHYITSPFSIGSLTIASSAQPLHYLNGPIAAGAQVLAEQLATANWTLVVLDAGAALEPAGTAAGRRVVLPWGQFSFDINSLTVDGQTLMQRAIEWATGLGSGGSPTLVLSINSAADQVFAASDPATLISTVTITDSTATPTITAANDLRIRVPAGFNMSWDTSITTVTLGGPQAGKVGATLLAYEDGGRTLVLDVTSDFAAGDQITITDPNFTSFSAPSSADNLELEVNNDNVVSATDDKTVTIIQVLSLVKRAFLADGTPVSDGSTLPQGIVVKFLIYFNNMGVVESDVSVRDVLNAVFAHQAATLKVNNTTAACAVVICTAFEEATIFTDVNATAAKTDAVDGDEISITGSTVDAGNENVANAAVNVAANKVWAMLVQVTIQ